MRFNRQKGPAGANTLNLAGGDAFTQTTQLELVSLFLTSTLTDQFYRKVDATVHRLKELISKTDKKFVAKAAIYARHEAGLRSITHLVAGELAMQVKAQPWTAKFFNKVIRRPDDAMEILAYYMNTYGRPIPNALKKGLGQALARFDEYQIAKYRKESAELSLVDVVNLVHPPHTDALAKLVKGTLSPAETWETKLTQAGSAAESEEELSEMKKDAWSEMFTDRKLGYFALLRNLRNILQQAPECIEPAIEMLVDEKLIRRSLVMPFRYLSALEALQSAQLPNAGPVMAALSQAVDKSLENVPRFEGNTLLALDGSGSMTGRPMMIGSIFAATLAKSNKAEVMLFSNTARYVSMNTQDSTLTLAKYLESQADRGGTDFHAIFQNATRAYDRIIILSDMQGWIGQIAPTGSLEKYCQKFGADPRVFSFDLQGYGTLQFPQRNVFCLAGISNKTLETLQQLDTDPLALIKTIEAIEL